MPLGMMRLRFTIRDLLWLTLVVALVIAWRLDHQKQVPLANAANAMIDTIVSQDPQIRDLEKRLTKLRLTLPIDAAQSAELQAWIKNVESELAARRAEIRPQIAEKMGIK
jgi:hypothetical protein